MGLLPLGVRGLPPLPPSFIYGGSPLEDTPISPSHVWVPPSQFTPSIIFSRCFGKALRGSHHHHRHHTVMLTELIYYFDPPLDQELEGRHRAECVQNSEVL